MIGTGGYLGEIFSEAAEALSSEAAERGLDGRLAVPEQEPALEEWETSLYQALPEEASENLKPPKAEMLEDLTAALTEGGPEAPGEVGEGLSGAGKTRLMEETGWSPETVEAIRSPGEAAIYQEAGLREAEINGKKCLIRQDIDLDQKDEFGHTNQERMADGLAPLSPSGETVELHHIGQKPDSPLAELTFPEHHRNGNDIILHDKKKAGEIDRSVFKAEREAHWRTRSAIG